MTNSRIAPMRPSIAKFLKKKIGGFVREYEREVNRDQEPVKKPEPAKPADAPAKPNAPQQPE
jgi:hypothetical protein